MTCWQVLNKLTGACWPNFFSYNLILLFQIVYIFCMPFILFKLDLGKEKASMLKALVYNNIYCVTGSANQYHHHFCFPIVHIWLCSHYKALLFLLSATLTHLVSNRNINIKECWYLYYLRPIIAYRCIV